LEVPLKINEHGLPAQKNHFISFSFPLSMGEVTSIEELQLLHYEEVQIAEYLILSYWPDSSLKWVKCNFVVDGTLPLIQDYAIKKNEHYLDVKFEQTIKCTTNQNTLKISNGIYNFHIHNDELLIDEIPWQFALVGINKEVLIPIVTLFKPGNDNEQLKREVIYYGEFRNSTNDVFLEFDCKFTFNAANTNIKIDFTLRNAKPMIHNDGKWDLGNDNSFFFESLNINFLNIDPAQTSLSITDQGKQSQQKGEFNLYQASSGGDNWNSTNHMNADGLVDHPFKGFQVTNNANVIESGNRAEPKVDIKLDNSHLSIVYKNFWQTFPKSITNKGNKVSLGLFPLKNTKSHELQPGEQVTHTFFLQYDTDFSNTPETEQQEFSVSICPDYLAKTNAIPYFSNSIDEEITDIINEGLTSDRNFFVKREDIDEYGWRNFGDIFADHETLEYQGDKELISHYNNQYDALYGFIRQFLVSGDTKWWQLASDLAQHIKDIDIYHTDKDKSEYNHGLFWHTDHYLPAETASHRTYSQRQQANAYQDHAGGGGPGGQHCYTTGLMLHYYLTTDETSKTAVIKLADWISNYYEGTGTVFEFLLGVRNIHLPGLKNKLTGQYPLDRGIGNYIIALLDAYELTNKQSYLDRVSLIIKNTATPEEDLAARKLSNIEDSWFYTIFLQAVLRYLLIKSQACQHDESCNYARCLLIHFANWMIDNEAPYLHTPEKLEYPNHTWAAQDIRKANVLYGAYYFAGSGEKNVMRYKAKADEFYTYVYSALKVEKSRTYTRILAILMQNSGFKSFVENNKLNTSSVSQMAMNKKNNSTSSISSTLEFMKAFIKTLKNTSLKKELTWLCFRSSKVEQVIGRYVK